jgi:uncharacterized protein YqgV (UPF0045/DUF77 family)
MRAEIKNEKEGMKAGLEEGKASQGGIKATVSGVQELMEATMDSTMSVIQEKLEATINAIWSELEETMTNKVEDVLASVDQLTQGHCKELDGKMEET